MRIDINALEYWAKHSSTAERNRVDIIAYDGKAFHRMPTRAEIELRIRSRPWVKEVAIHEQMLLTRGATDICDFLEEEIHDGAIALRGAIFRDLVDNMNDYPVDFIGDGTPDDVMQRCERVSMQLMEHVQRQLKRHARSG